MLPCPTSFLLRMRRSPRSCLFTHRRTSLRGSWNALHKKYTTSKFDSDEHLKYEVLGDTTRTSWNVETLNHGIWASPHCTSRNELSFKVNESYEAAQNSSLDRKLSATLNETPSTIELSRPITHEPNSLEVASTELQTAVSIRPAGEGALLELTDQETMPTLSYDKDPRGYKVWYVKTTEEAEEAAALLKGHIMGMDTEWALPSMRSADKRNCISLVQMCDTHGTIVVFHVEHMSPFPNKLREILEDRNILKFGSCISGDGSRLKKYPHARWGLSAEENTDSFLTSTATNDVWEPILNVEVFPELVSDMAEARLEMHDEMSLSHRLNAEALQVLSDSSAESTSQADRKLEESVRSATETAFGKTEVEEEQAGHLVTEIQSKKGLIIARSIVDLGPLAVQVADFSMYGNRPQQKLETMVNILLGCELLKPQTTVCSDWDRPTLTDEQVLYSANDAYASLRLAEYIQLHQRKFPTITGTVEIGKLRKGRSYADILSHVSRELGSASLSYVLRIKDAGEVWRINEGTIDDWVRNNTKSPSLANAVRPTATNIPADKEDQGKQTIVEV